MKDYRKLFKESYNINFNKNYEIHHIDLNHENNSIDNLMILPKNLHSQYHYLLNAVGNMDDVFIVTFYSKIHGSCINGDNYNLSMCEELIKVLRECNKWYDYKLYLEGKLPNIHNIEVN